jgi:hypothetical protein
MSLLYVTEFAEAGRYGGGVIPVARTGQWLENANSPITISGASAASAKFGTYTNLVRLHTDTICSIYITTAGTAATTSNARMAANQTEYFAVIPGQIVTVIANT